MKNLLLVLSVLFLFGLTSCSDVMDNSFPTNPGLEKDGGNDIFTPSSHPYPYLFNFTKIEGVKYSRVNLDENAIELYLPTVTRRYVQFYVVVSYINDKPNNLFFIDKFNDGSFIVSGLNSSEVLDVSVYGFGSRNDIVPPFSNNTMMKEITHIWGTDGENLKVEYLGVRPTNFKYVFAEIETREGSQFIFLHKPVSQSFTIPGYGKGAVGLKLYGYYTYFDNADLAN
ncbi:MAG: hypothetical protein LC124_08240 [Ignavibacteriales bacterium]|nr:hypothetical protein [Ignavibacteriota bacterium]MBW7842278.1 hypothetical protein [Ignavibacterium sp.]MCZ2268829.1 hypothetical protein [Ignavibacteriales bacterium]HMN18253.1 hypothetical protein [Ignavibacteriaceae bacterium]HOJ07744.1 hypothetical protein [Ignavibacteriaceae bacterium]